MCERLHFLMPVYMLLVVGVYMLLVVGVYMLLVVGVLNVYDFYILCSLIFFRELQISVATKHFCGLLDFPTW